MVQKVYIKGTIGSRTNVHCYSEKGLQPNWYQKCDDGKTVLLPPSFQESAGVIKIWGKTRKVLLLKIISLGHGSLGTYSCRVNFSNTSLESFVHISSTKDGKHTNFKYKTFESCNFLLFEKTYSRNVLLIFVKDNV